MLNEETIESVTTFFQALFEQKKLDGTIKRQEGDCIRKRLLCKAPEKLHICIHKASNSRRSQRTRREIALCNDRRQYVDKRGDWCHCRHIHNNPDGNDRRRSYGALKRYRGERSARNGYRSCNTQPREQKSLAGCKKDGRGKSTPCKMHSYLGRLAKHSWADCLENPANQKKPAAKRAEAYYAHNEHCPASNAASLSNHHTALASNKSSDKYSSCSDYSNNKGNFTIAISTAPRKQAKGKALPSKKELTIAMSESDDDIDDDATSAKLGKLVASYAAGPLVGNKCRRSKDAQPTP